jgi:hypothetical protein
MVSRPTLKSAARRLAGPTAWSHLADLRRSWRRRRQLPRLDQFRPRSCLALPHHEVDRARFPAVDAHNHLGRWLSPDASWMVPDVTRLVAMMDELNLATIVNLDGRWGRELDENLDRYDGAHPGRFATFCHVDWAEVATPGFTDRLIVSLQTSSKRGAAGLKVWKDLGLTVRDPSGRLLLPDDPRFDDLWTAAGELDLPVLVHVGDPVAFFRPADATNERLEELVQHPANSRADLGVPALDRLLAALEAMVAAHPATRFIAAHVGCHAEDLAAVGAQLDRYPNLTIDLAGRLPELGRQPRAARRLIVEHPDRVLFGSDNFPVRAVDYKIWFRFLETEDEHFPYSAAPAPPFGRWAVSGLDLPVEILEALYAGNARAMIPALAISPAGTERASSTPPGDPVR